MNKDQNRHLDGRIAVAKHRLHKKLSGKATAAERHAERMERVHQRLSRKYGNRKYRLQEAREKKAKLGVERHANAVREAMLFGDAKKALAAVKALEKAAR